MVGARAREAGAVAAGALQLVVGGEGVEGDAVGGGWLRRGQACLSYKTIPTDSPTKGAACIRPADSAQPR